MASSRLARREAIRDADNTDIPSLPILAIRGQLCFRCLQHTEGLLKCSACGRASYCSIDCQVADWHIAHRKLCPAFQNVDAAGRDESTDEQTWSEYTNALHRKAQLAKQGVHDDHSGDLVQTIIGQPYCSSCHRYSNQLSSLRPCGVCKLVFTCENCISTHDSAECQHYRLLGDLEKYKLQQFEAESTVSSMEKTDGPRSLAQYRPLASYDGWVDYFRSLSDKRNVGSFFAADFTFDCTGSGSGLATSRDRWLHLLLATDSLTIPLTILAALEDAVPDFLERRTLSIQLIGAAGKEFRNLKLFEEILHLLPTVRHLKIVLVGPESPGESAGQTGDLEQEIEMECCSICTSDGRRRTVTSFQGGYHEYIERPAYRKPDLAVLFHSGRSQANIESWKPTTRILVESGTCTLCTTYTEREAREECAELDDLRAVLLVAPEVNRWRGLAPLPELLDGDEHSAYYHNFYRYLFRGRL